MRFPRAIRPARIRRLGYNPRDPESVAQYLKDADDFDDPDWYPWHSEFSEDARRVDTDNPTIHSLVIEN